MTYSSDVAISMPEPYDAMNPTLVPMGGFGVTRFGLQHDLSKADAEELRRPSYSPPLNPKDIQYGDGN